MLYFYSISGWALEYPIISKTFLDGLWITLLSIIFLNRSWKTIIFIIFLCGPGNTILSIDIFRWVLEYPQLKKLLGKFIWINNIFRWVLDYSYIFNISRWVLEYPYPKNTPKYRKTRQINPTGYIIIFSLHLQIVELLSQKKITQFIIKLGYINSHI